MTDEIKTEEYVEVPNANTEIIPAPKIKDNTLISVRKTTAKSLKEIRKDKESYNDTILRLMEIEKRYRI